MKISQEGIPFPKALYEGFRFQTKRLRPLVIDFDTCCLFEWHGEAGKEGLIRHPEKHALVTHRSPKGSEKVT